jgi:hypothetical protein
MHLSVQRALIFLVLTSVPLLALSRGGFDDLQSRFEHEPNSVHKAKLFERLGDEQLDQVRRASLTSDYSAVGQLMEKYRDNARIALDALEKEHPNAEHQLNGYKQLQMHIRKALRDLKEILLLAPPEIKPPLQLVQQDLASMDDELLRSLFPAHPGTKNPVVPGPGAAVDPRSPASDKGAPDKSAPDSGYQPVENAEQKIETPPEAANQVKPSAPPETKADSDVQQELAESPQEKTEMNMRDCLLTAVVTCGLAVSCAQLQAQQDQKDYLSSTESDKIRDAANSNTRINLFITFADDRLKKFQYELQHPSSNRHGELLNALMNGYVGCLDDAADLMQLGIEKQENIRQGIDFISAKSKEFLEALNKIAADKIDIDIYKDNLDDAIEGTRDAISDSEKAKKAVAPPPVRRKS